MPLILTYRVAGLDPIRQPISSVDDAVAFFNSHRDRDGFGSRDLLTKVFVLNDCRVVAEIAYNGTVYPKVHP